METERDTPAFGLCLRF